MDISPVEIGYYIVAGILVATKLIKSCKVWWDKLPHYIAVVLPVLVLALPQVVAAAGLIRTRFDLISFGVTAIALLLPGIIKAEKNV